LGTLARELPSNRAGDLNVWEFAYFHKRSPDRGGEGASQRWRVSSSAFAIALERLEQLARDLVNQTVGHRFLTFDPDFTVEDYHACMDLMLERMVSDGEILPGQRVSFSRWMTKDEDAATRRKAAEAAEWAPSPEAMAVSPEPVAEPRHYEEDDLAAEMHRKFTRPLDELWPLPKGIV
jgi:hypothetical protein